MKPKFNEIVLNYIRKRMSKIIKNVSWKKLMQLKMFSEILFLKVWLPQMILEFIILQALFNGNIFLKEIKKVWNVKYFKKLIEW